MSAFFAGHSIEIATDETAAEPSCSSLPDAGATSADPFSSATSPGAAEPMPIGAARTLRGHEVLFAAGQPRYRLFQLEAGAVCSFRQLPDGRREVVDFAVTGDIVGLGGLDCHLWSAEAITETRVRCLAVGTTDDVAALDPAVRARLTAAIERELAIVRNACVEAGRNRPIERLASFLVAVSSNNGYEGRDRRLIGDDLQCSMVTEALGLDIDELSRQLATLARLGLVEPSPHGLRLTDLDALEQLADGA